MIGFLRNVLFDSTIVLEITYPDHAQFERAAHNRSA